MVIQVQTVSTLYVNYIVIFWFSTLANIVLGDVKDLKNNLGPSKPIHSSIDCIAY